MSARAQTLPFGSAFLPTFSFTERYTDTVVLGDFEYEQRPDSALVVNARVSMKDVVVADLTAEDSALVVNVANLQFYLSLVDAEQTVAGTYTVYTWPLTSISPYTGEDLSVGSVVLQYNATELKLTINADDAPQDFSLYALQAAGSEETIEDGALVLNFSVGPYGMDGVTLYMRGTASVFDKTVGTGDSAQTFYGLAKVNLTGGIDTDAPKVVITYPTPRGTITDRPITATGWFTDSHGILAIEAQVDGGDWLPGEVAVDGKWSVPGIELRPGANDVRVRATDLDGHYGSATVRCYFSARSNLTVAAAGDSAGRITSALFPPIIFDPSAAAPSVVTKQMDGASLVISAVPGPSSVFDGWTTNKTLTAAQLASPRLGFKHQPNMVLTAKFLINPFTPVKGYYNGLATAALPENSGFFAVTLAGNGGFSGSLKLGALTLKLKGQFSNTGRFAKQIRVRRVDYTVDLTLNVTGTGARQITGTVTGGNVNVTIVASLSPFDKNANPALQAGTYNVIIPPDPAQPALYPAGIGFGRVTVTPAGHVRFIGRTGTGPTFNAAARLSANGEWPFFGALYAKRGSIRGVVAFDLANPAHDLSGSLAWFRPANVPGIPVHPEGFSGQSTMLGAKHTRPLSGQRLFLGPSSGEGNLTLNAPANGALPVLQATLATTLGIDNRFTFGAPPAPIDGVQTSVNPVTGFFTGRFTENGTLVRSSGIVVGRKLSRAAGFFRRGLRTGAVEIVAP
ncbi:MAG: hypothetical protein ABMA13_21610 [Chthoniobacteraceae bacterium]